MSKSQALRGQDVQAVYEIVNECRDLGCDAREWLQHLARQLRSLLALRACTTGEGWGPGNGQGPTLPLMLEAGLDAAALALFRHYAASGAVGRDPAWVFSWQCPAPWAVLAPERLVGKRTWLTSDVYNDYYRPARCDHQLLSYHVLPGADARFYVSLWRAADMPRFGRRDRALIGLVQQTFGPLLGGPLATARDPGLSGLAPRLRQTLHALLEGDSEKQAALRLGVSASTVHEYVTGLYRHFGVASRAELLACFLRRLRGQRRESPQAE